jgi:hypothetical protein
VIDAFSDFGDAVFTFDISYTTGGSFDAATQTRINSRTYTGAWRGIRTNFSESDIKDMPISKTIVGIIAIASEEPFQINTNENYTIDTGGEVYLVKRIIKDPANVTYTFLCIEA